MVQGASPAAPVALLTALGVTDALMRALGARSLAGPVQVQRQAGMIIGQHCSNPPGERASTSVCASSAPSTVA